MRAGQPPVPMPTTRMSVSSSSVMSAISGASPSQSEAAASAEDAAPRVMVLPLAWDIQSAAAVRMALDVTVAPVTALTSAVWAVRIASSICPPIFPPMSAVSPDTSMLTAVMASSSKVMVTVTSLWMPRAEAE